MQEWIAQCRCKEVALKAAGKPIVSSACYCSDCQTAGRRLEQLSDAPGLVSDDGGTAMILFRKDRIEIMIGEELLREYHLTPGSPTRRVVATCCNSPMFLDYTRGFWLSVYADRIVGRPPALQMRTVVKERPNGVVLPNDVPNHDGHSGTFMMRLMLAWAAMGFRSPKLDRYAEIAIPTP